MDEDSSKRLVLLLRDSCEHDTMTQQVFALGRVHDHSIDENSTRDDVIEIDLTGVEVDGFGA